MSNTYEKSVKYDRTTKDFSVTVNGELIGFADSTLAGEQMAREYIASQIENDTQAATSAAPVVTSAAKFTPATRASIAAAVAQARAAAQDQARWVRAINRAYEELLTGQWAWHGDRLIIASRSRPGKRHSATATQCSCEAFAAGKPCYHRASVRLLQRASGLVA